MARRKKSLALTRDLSSKKTEYRVRCTPPQFVCTTFHNHLATYTVELCPLLLPPPRNEMGMSTAFHNKTLSYPPTVETSSAGGLLNAGIRESIACRAIVHSNASCETTMRAFNSRI